MQYIPINKETLPEQFELNFGGENYTLRFDYNLTYDFFSVSSYRMTEEGRKPIVEFEKLVLEKPLWSDFIPEVGIGYDMIPMDLSGLEDQITWDNFGKTVFLYVDDSIEFVTSFAGGEDEV